MARPAPPPLLEDELGVAGAPIDQTEFEFETEPLAGPQRLETQGMPEISVTEHSDLGPFLDARRSKLQSVGADGSWITFISRIGQTAQAYRLDQPLGSPRQITFNDEPVVQIAGVPKVREAYTFRADVAGTEDYQIYRTGQGVTMLTDGESRHGPFRWSAERGLLAFTGNARDPASMDVYVGGAEPGAKPRLLLKREGSWTANAWSRDGTALLIRRYLGFNHSIFHVVDVDTGGVEPLGELRRGVAQTRARFGVDDEIYLVSNRDADVLDVYRARLGTDAWTNLTDDLSAEVDELAVDPPRGRIAFTTNDDGISRLWVQERGDRRQVDLPIGVVSSLRFTQNGDGLAFTLDRPTDPGDVYTYDIPNQSLVRWTNSMPRALRAADLVEPRLVRYESFDGVEVSAWAYLPDGDGPHPALLWIHGGPEEQFRPTFNPMIQYLVTRRGIAVIGPNIRGSTGYGRTFVSLDDGRKREDSIRDIGALLDWIDTEETLDASRVGIYGGSYGGYVVLASMIRYPDRLAAGCDMVGIANFVTFLENTRSYRVDQRRAEYGDERDPEMRAFLEEISPVNNADRLTKPLFIVHGANDPRVPLDEARQMYEAVREQGQEAWLMVAHDEGHGFRKRYNRDVFYNALVTFFQKHLTEGTP